MGKKGGAATTEAKKKASQENGKKGGRPVFFTKDNFKEWFENQENAMSYTLKPNIKTRSNMGYWETEVLFNSGETSKIVYVAIH
jgi:hypothetical protein